MSKFKIGDRVRFTDPGKEFGAYELVATRKEAKVYDFEWQRLAAGGEKIAAIKSLRGITGQSLKSAKDAVEHFVEAQLYRANSRRSHAGVGAMLPRAIWR